MDEPTGFAPSTGITWQGHTGIVEYGGGDRNQFCVFYNKSVPDPAKSIEAGRPINMDQVFVRVHPPGERLNIVDRPARGDDAKRWPTQWHAFQQNRQQTPEGTPIDILYPESPSVGANLRANNVFTVEQCAELSFHAIETIGMGAQRWVNDAKKFIEFASKGVTASAMRKELEDRDREIKVLRDAVEEMRSTIIQLREGASNSAALQQVQQLLAGQMQRPEHLARSAGFDSQAALINAAGRDSRPIPKRRVRG